MNKMVLPNEILLGEVSELLSEGRPVVIMTKGGSMMPFIRGEVDSVRLERRDSYCVGQAVLAQIAPGHYVLHRIVEISPSGVTLQGDGNLYGQEHCRVEDIEGLVTAIVRPSGKLASPCDGVASFWRKLHPFVRRCVLGVYRRII